MQVRVVCISRTAGASGEAVGQEVAQRLGYRYIDEQIITKAARQAQVDPALVAATEHRAPLLKRLLDKLPAARDLVGPVTLATGVPVDAFAPSPGGYRASPQDLRVLIRAAIYEIAAAGKVVIVAHAASMALRDQEGVLRVLVTASPDTRAQRLQAAQGNSAAEAQTAIAASDRERLDYFRQFYNLTEELPTHYDLVINTDVLTSEQATALIVSVAQDRTHTDAS